MKTDGYVDRSLDDFIKANRGMFRRGRGGAVGAARGAASTRGDRGRGQSRGSARGRSSSRGAARGSGRGRASSRGVSRGRATTPRGRGRGASRGGRGQRGAARTTRGSRGARGARGASFSQRWRSSSDRMGSHLEAAAPAATPSPIKRRQRRQEMADSEAYRLRHSIHIPAPLQKIHRNLIATTVRTLQLAVKAVRSSKLAGRLGTPVKGANRAATLALKKKRQALQQLSIGTQLSRVDARNQILMKRRGLTERAAAAAGPARRGRGASRGASAAGRRAPPLPQGRVQVIHESPPAPAPLRRPLNRTRVPDSTVTPPDGASLLTVQFKNDIAVRQRRPPPPIEMDMDDADMSLPPSPPPQPPPPPPPRSRGGLDPRIQQEIAAIQARGRSQHHLPADGQSSGVSNFRPTASTSSRSLNDRFTADRVIFS